MSMPGSISGTEPIEEITSGARSSCSEPGIGFGFAAFDFGLRHLQSDQATVFDDQARRQPAILEAKQILVARQAQHFLAHLFGLGDLLGRGVVGRLRERHILLAAAVDQKAAFHAQLLRLDAVCLAGRRDALFQLVHVGLDAASFQSALVILQLKNFHHVDRGQARRRPPELRPAFRSAARGNPFRSCGCTSR